MFGFGVLRGMMVTLKHFVETYTEDPKRVKAHALTPDAIRQTPNDVKGLFTVQYPEEKLAIPERFRFFPMLIVDGETGQDLCTSCGICAKVCPPQCIWIVRGTKPDGKPKPEPEEFYIDTTICMQCGYCAEFCPFDAIKMNHDYELSAYERHESAIYNKDMLSVTTTYYARTHPRAWAEESAAQAAKDAKKAGAGVAADETAEVATPASAVASGDTLPSGRPKPISARAAKAARLAAQGGAESHEAHGAAAASGAALSEAAIEAAAETPIARPTSSTEMSTVPSTEAGVLQPPTASAAEVEQVREDAEQRGASAQDMGSHGAGDPLLIPNNRITEAGSAAADAAAAAALASPKLPVGLPPQTTDTPRAVAAAEPGSANAPAGQAGQVQSPTGDYGALEPVTPALSDTPMHVETPLAAEEASEAAATAPVDDLTLIEGIGPKIAQLLYGAGITSFKQLADTPTERLDQIVAGAGPSAQPPDTSRWVEQARAAAARD